ncbi:hypothetical protein NCM_05455 [Burkholderia pseudomallei]
MRPSRPASGTGCSATTGNSATVLPSATSFTEPTTWPSASGAMSGAFSATSGFTLSARPRGTVMNWSFFTPTCTLLLLPL